MALLSKQQHFLSSDKSLSISSFLGIIMEIFFKLLTPSLNNHTVLRVSKMSKHVVESLEINRREESPLTCNMQSQENLYLIFQYFICS